MKATGYMAKRRIGAIMSFERETGLTDYVETGIPIHSKLTSELLTNIFVPNTPLHDGAVILRPNEIIAAGCYLPLTESPFVSKELGTRHRAAIGVSEVTDAITVVVSEETGGVSITKNGEIHRNLDEESLKNLLTAELMGSGRSASSSRWNWRGRKMDKLLRSNWFVKIIAFLLALMLYTVISMEDQQQTSRNALFTSVSKNTQTVNGVEIVPYFDENKYVLTDMPRSVDVKLTGESNLVTKALKVDRKIQVYIDLTKLGPGTHTVPVKLKNVPDELDAVPSQNK